MTLDELENKLPNGFHDAEIYSFEVNYIAGVVKFHLNLLVGWPGDPEPERHVYQEASLVVSGLCFCCVQPPDSNYNFLPNSKPICVSGDPAKADHLPSLLDLVSKCPGGTWAHRFFVHDWNAFIYIAGRDAELTWVGAKPNHAI